MMGARGSVGRDNVVMSAMGMDSVMAYLMLVQCTILDFPYPIFYKLY